MDGSIALVEFSKPSRRNCVKTFEYAHIEVGLNIWFRHSVVLDRERVVGRDGGLARGDLAVEDLGLLLHLPRDALEVELVALELGARALRGALRVDGALVPGQKRVIQVLFMSVPRARVPEKASMLRDRSKR